MYLYSHHSEVQFHHTVERQTFKDSYLYVVCVGKKTIIWKNHSIMAGSGWCVWGLWVASSLFLLCTPLDRDLRFLSWDLLKSPLLIRGSQARDHWCPHPLHPFAGIAPGSHAPSSWCYCFDTTNSDSISWRLLLYYVSVFDRSHMSDQNIQMGSYYSLPYWTVKVLLYKALMLCIFACKRMKCVINNSV